MGRTPCYGAVAAVLVIAVAGGDRLRAAQTAPDDETLRVFVPGGPDRAADVSAALAAVGFPAVVESVRIPDLADALRRVEAVALGYPEWVLDGLRDTDDLALDLEEPWRVGFETWAPIGTGGSPMVEMWGHVQRLAVMGRLHLRFPMDFAPESAILAELDPEPQRWVHAGPDAPSTLPSESTLDDVLRSLKPGAVALAPVGTAMRMTRHLPDLEPILMEEGWIAVPVAAAARRGVSPAVRGSFRQLMASEMGGDVLIEAGIEPLDTMVREESWCRDAASMRRLVSAGLELEERERVHQAWLSGPAPPSFDVHFDEWFDILALLAMLIAVVLIMRPWRRMRRWIGAKR